MGALATMTGGRNLKTDTGQYVSIYNGTRELSDFSVLGSMQGALAGQSEQ